MLNELPLDCSPALVRVIKTTSAVKNLQQLAQDADLALLQVRGTVSSSWNPFKSWGVFFLCSTGFLWYVSTSVLSMWAECTEKAWALELTGGKVEEMKGNTTVRAQSCSWIQAADCFGVARVPGGLQSTPLVRASPVKQAAQGLSVRILSTCRDTSHSLSGPWSSIWPASEKKLSSYLMGISHSALCALPSVPSLCPSENSSVFSVPFN